MRKEQGEKGENAGTTTDLPHEHTHTHTHPNIYTQPQKSPSVILAAPQVEILLPRLGEWC